MTGVRTKCFKEWMVLFNRIVKLAWRAKYMWLIQTVGNVQEYRGADPRNFSGVFLYLLGGTKYMCIFKTTCVCNLRWIRFWYIYVVSFCERFMEWNLINFSAYLWRLLPKDSEKFHVFIKWSGLRIFNLSSKIFIISYTLTSEISFKK